ncbi:hypothetical protein S7711_08252 [Stachybotrys chartarum IBT 7711]|uniref:ENTH domain-containing protein n=1 Tax=Stachybotrys chartarum (strain CBS 109288 / IBT 7711) TaxID=1280523 RepID=A0A084AQK0_STACB|nr:hypothetical protein S7711_08252 [Stachybotrys chartarum IBT 7711]KFA56260.1 hypothetical protein S40293_00180 [Stachybotrys chartarum IBT 40293]KFA72055.1 hypothetical protein S40288_02266 [Stachybotrys chartarum IBT 40288]
MASSFEKSVKGATKIKNAPPKTKYIEHLLVATHAGEAGIAEVFRALQFRLRDSTWTVVFKGLITVHLMIREGSPDVTLSFLAKNRNMLAISNFTDAQTQGRNIRHYANYLSERSRAYRDTQTDWVRAPESRLEKLSVDKGLLRETESVQRQLTALLKCDVLDTDGETEITITVFRLLVLDLLSLFQVLNQGLINILGHFFEMSKTDAERAMDIYRNFTKQTDFVVAYLGVARQHEHHTRVEVPKLKHAPVNLGRQLEEYLRDPDFEIHRRQYIAEQEAKKRGGGVASSSKPVFKSAANDTPKVAVNNNPFPSTNGAKVESKPVATKGPDPDLIDFFDSIEQNQTTMQVNSQQPVSAPAANNAFQQQHTSMAFQANNGFAQQQPTGFPNNDIFQQQTGAFGQQQQQPPQLQTNFTGAGFGGFSPQPSTGFQPSSLASIPQNSVASFPSQMTAAPMQFNQTGQPAAFQPQQTGQPGGLQPQVTNPFRQSMLMSQQTGMQQTGSPTFGSTGLQRTSTNPFARSVNTGSPASSGTNSPFQPQLPSFQPQSPPMAAPLQATPTGTNPFARSTTLPPVQEQRPQTAGGALVPQPTGSTNPFRQSAFVDHTTGRGWQHNQSLMGGGLDQLPTQPVFPRPAQQTPWQQ